MRLLLRVMPKDPDAMYLFSPDVISNIFKKRPSSRLLDHLAPLAPDDQHICGTYGDEAS